MKYPDRIEVPETNDTFFRVSDTQEVTNHYYVSSADSKKIKSYKIVSPIYFSVLEYIQWIKDNPKKMENKPAVLDSKWEEKATKEIESYSTLFNPRLVPHYLHEGKLKPHLYVSSFLGKKEVLRENKTPFLAIISYKLLPNLDDFVSNRYPEYFI